MDNFINYSAGMLIAAVVGILMAVSWVYVREKTGNLIITIVLSVFNSAVFVFTGVLAYLR